MDRLTRKSQTSDMVWFIDNDTNIDLEPCEMRGYHIRKVLQKLSEYEDSEERGELTSSHIFKEEDFTEDEFQLLKIAFKLIGDVVEMQREGNSDVYMCNELYHLKEKLGIVDLLL